MLKVSCKAARLMTEQRMDRGMEIAMISVLRQFPRKSKIMPAVRHAAIKASRTTPLMEARTNSGLIEQELDIDTLRERASTRFRVSFMLLTISSVEARHFSLQ